MIANFCSSADSSEDRDVCTNILAVLDKEDLCSFFRATEVPMVRYIEEEPFYIIANIVY